MSESCCSKKSAPQPAVPKASFGDILSVYRPIIIVFLVSVVCGLSLSVLHPMSVGDAVMVFFLIQLAVLQLLSLSKFVESFLQYDVLAKRAKFYAYVYPFIELSLACLYLLAFWPVATNAAMLAVMLLGIVGIVKAFLSGQNYTCACVGGAFQLPVGRVTLLENAMMGGMALMNLLILLT
jgi:hypothetical protein